MGIFTSEISRKSINIDLGILLIRLGVGFSVLFFHGYGKISGGSELWEKIGSSMGNVGIGFLPVFWGFMAAFSEFFCSILVMLGVFFRFGTIMLSLTMTVAIFHHLNLPAGADAAGWSGASHALELLTVYAGLFFCGPGKYKISKY